MSRNRKNAYMQRWLQYFHWIIFLFYFMSAIILKAFKWFIKCIEWLLSNVCSDKYIIWYHANNYLYWRFVYQNWMSLEKTVYNYFTYLKWPDLSKFSKRQNIRSLVSLWCIILIAFIIREPIKNGHQLKRLQLMILSMKFMIGINEWVKICKIIAIVYVNYFITNPYNQMNLESLYVWKAQHTERLRNSIRVKFILHNNRISNTINGIAFQFVLKWNMELFI